MQSLKGKTALITGASRGIGKAIALIFAEQGANIVFTHLSSIEQGQEVIKELEKLNVQAVGYHSDVANFNHAQDLLETIIQKFGRLDILVNNAGISRDNLLLRMSEQDWDEVIKVNLKSVFNLIKASIPSMIRQRAGSIINISSVVGIKGNTGQANYAASKAGVIGITKSVALELGSRNVRCNAIAPGFIETAMTAKLSQEAKAAWINNIPLKRAGTPEDVAQCALFLASDNASYITGQVIQVDGGMVT